MLLLCRVFEASMGLTGIPGCSECYQHVLVGENNLFMDVKQADSALADSKVDGCGISRSGNHIWAIHIKTTFLKTRQGILIVNIDVKNIANIMLLSSSFHYHEPEED